MRLLILFILLSSHTFLEAQRPTLIWSDEFDGDGLDTSNWSFQLGNVPAFNQSLSKDSTTAGPSLFNPVRDSLSIQFDPGLKATLITISDINGKIVKIITENITSNNRFIVSNLHPGFYHAKVNFDDGSFGAITFFKE